MSTGTNKKKLNTNDLEALRLGGVYIPPFKMRQIEAKLATNKKSEAYQRLQWEALRKSINGPINKVNKHNLTEIVVELLNENIIRGRGLFCRSIMKSQISSPSYTNIYACLVCIINTKIPEIGDLLCRRLINQFQRNYKRNSKLLLKNLSKFIGHLINYQVLHELCGLQIIQLLLTNPTNDSIEIVKDFILQTGNVLSKLSPKAMRATFKTLKDILQEVDNINIRVQYELESLFKSFKNNFADYPIIDNDLDLIDEDDIITHNISLIEKVDVEKMLNIFHYDIEWDKHEQEYDEIRREILGDDSDDDSDDNDDNDDDSDSDDDDDDSDSDDDEDDEEDGDNDNDDNDNKTNDIEIEDLTNSSVMNLRRSIYLTIVSSLTSEEMAHKILSKFEDSTYYKHVSHMILESCGHERSYRKQYGLLAERLSKLKAAYEDCFDELFVRQYNNIHQLDTNKIRNVSKFFAHLLYTNALDWSILEFIKLNERDTNPSKRIFIKILFQELASFLGKNLRIKLFDPNYGKSFDNIFPKNNPKDTRFSINFFTTIGLGGLTEDMRNYLKMYHKNILKKQQQMLSSDEDDSDSDSDSDSDDDSDDSDSDSDSDDTSSSDDDKHHKRKQYHQKRKDKQKKRSKSKSKSKSLDKQYRNRSKSRSRSRSRSKSNDRNKSRSRSRHSLHKKRTRNKSPEQYNDRGRWCS